LLHTSHFGAVDKFRKLFGRLNGIFLLVFEYNSGAVSKSRPVQPFNDMLGSLKVHSFDQDRSDRFGSMERRK
jgi:hypothetical protein